MMKKLILFCLISVILLLLIGCNFSENNQVEDSQVLTYSMQTGNGDYTDAEINASLFNELINNLNPTEWNFIILSPSKPVNNSTFIQVGTSPAITDSNELTIEIAFDDKSGRKMYRYETEDRDIVLQYFIDYWEKQQVPDISSWQDVTDEILNQ